MTYQVSKKKKKMALYNENFLSQTILDFLSDSPDPKDRWTIEKSP